MCVCVCERMQKIMHLAEDSDNPYNHLINDPFLVFFVVLRRASSSSIVGQGETAINSVTGLVGSSHDKLKFGIPRLGYWMKERRKENLEDSSRFRRPASSVSLLINCSWMWASDASLWTLLLEGRKCAWPSAVDTIESSNPGWHGVGKPIDLIKSSTSATCNALPHTI